MWNVCVNKLGNAEFNTAIIVHVFADVSAATRSRMRYLEVCTTVRAYVRAKLLAHTHPQVNAHRGSRIHLG